VSMKRLVVLAILGTFAAMMIVPAHACYYSPGWWKKHDWPVPIIALCGQTLTEEEGQALLKTPIKGDLTIQLAHQLIAAKLNWESGATLAYSGGLIDNAEAFLCSVGGVPPNPPLSTEDHETCSDWIELLDAANNTPW